MKEMRVGVFFWTQCSSVF